jgi:hypothetical protein
VTLSSPPPPQPPFSNYSFLVHHLVNRDERHLLSQGNGLWLLSRMAVCTHILLCSPDHSWIPSCCRSCSRSSPCSFWPVHKGAQKRSQCVTLCGWSGKSQCEAKILLRANRHLGCTRFIYKYVLSILAKQGNIFVQRYINTTHVLEPMYIIWTTHNVSWFTYVHTCKFRVFWGNFLSHYNEICVLCMYMRLFRRGKQKEVSTFSRMLMELETCAYMIPIWRHTWPISFST